MRLAQYDVNGKPQDVIKIIDKPTPKPGKGEVTIQIEAAPIHLADLYCMMGKESFKMPLPATPGFEGVGRILEVGDGVNNFKEGDRVFPPLASNTWCDVIRVSCKGLIRAPKGRSDILSLLSINPPTSYLILEDFGNLKEGDWIIQNAANSNCGRYLIELAKLKGIKTVNLVRREEVIPDLIRLGGDVVLVDNENISEEMIKATNGAKPKLGIDAVNGMATARMANCLEDNSTILAYGMLTDEPCMLPADVVFMRNIKLEGFYTIRQFENRTELEIAEIYKHLSDLFESGNLSTEIAQVYSLDMVKDAVEHAGRRGSDRNGKIILTMEN